MTSWPLLRACRVRIRFEQETPPVVLNSATIDEAIAHLSKADPKMESLLARVGVEALKQNIGEVRPLT